MRQAAYAVESRLPFEDSAEPSSTDADHVHGGERLLLVIGPDPSSAVLVRRGRRVADYLRAECLAVYVSTTTDFRELTPAQREALQRHLNFARGLQIETRVLQGTDIAATIVNNARLHGVTQIFLTRQGKSVAGSWFGQGLVQKIVNLARDMQVTVVADRSVRRAID
jgi:two-component system sensor histidine kinase KdpD